MTKKMPDHRNSFTSEILGNSVQVCPSCHRNFASTNAGDSHRVWRDGTRICLKPNSIGLQLTINSNGSKIYRSQSSPQLRKLIEQLNVELDTSIAK
jgi:hypothetical protein